MRVIVPFTQLDPATEAALQRYAPSAERIPVSPRDDTDYARVLREAWAQGAATGQDLLVVEHDIEIREGLLEEARACTELWCCWPYPGQGWSGPGDALIYRSLGCTRFAGELMRAEPDLLEFASQIDNGRDIPRGSWRRLDVCVQPTLESRGYRHHQHWPPVVHHHLYAEGCACGGVHD